MYCTKILKMNQISNGLFILLLCLGILPKNSKCQNSSLSDEECDTTIFCRYTTDNSIYQAYREFTYLLTTTVEPEDFRYYENSNPSDIFQEQMLLKLKVIPDCYHEQTMVKYEYLVRDSVFSEELTGLIEDKKLIWIHPPRDLINEVAFSPYFEFRHGKKKWKNGLIMGNNNPEITDKKMVWASHKYTVAKDTLVRYMDEDILCKNIRIKTRHRRTNYLSTMLFNEKFGFVRMDVHFINGKRYSLELVGVEQDYCKGKLSGSVQVQK
jgi:hypothetical protein